MGSFVAPQPKPQPIGKPASLPPSQSMIGPNKPKPSPLAAPKSRISDALNGMLPAKAAPPLIPEVAGPRTLTPQEKARQNFAGMTPEQRQTMFGQNENLQGLGGLADFIAPDDAQWNAAMADPEGSIKPLYEEILKSTGPEGFGVAPDVARRAAAGHDFLRRRFVDPKNPTNAPIVQQMQEAGTHEAYSPAAAARALQGAPPEYIAAMQKAQQRRMLQVGKPGQGLDAHGNPRDMFHDPDLPQQSVLWGASGMTPDQYHSFDWSDQAKVRKQFPELEQVANRYGVSMEDPATIAALSQAAVRHSADHDVHSAGHGAFDPFSALRTHGYNTQVNKANADPSTVWGHRLQHAFGLRYNDTHTNQQKVDVDPFNHAGRSWADLAGGAIGAGMDSAAGVATVLPALAGDLGRAAWEGRAPSLEMSGAATRNALSLPNLLMNTDIGANAQSSGAGSMMGPTVTDSGARTGQSMFSRWSAPVQRDANGQVAAGPENAFGGAGRERPGMLADAASEMNVRAQDPNRTTFQRSVNSAGSRTMNFLNSFGPVSLGMSGVGALGKMISGGRGAAVSGAAPVAAGAAPAATAASAAVPAAGLASRVGGVMQGLGAYGGTTGTLAGAAREGVQAGVQHGLGEVALDPNNSQATRWMASLGQQGAGLAEAALQNWQSGNWLKKPVQTLLGAAGQYGVEAVTEGAQSVAMNNGNLPGQTPLQAAAAPLIGYDPNSPDQAGTVGEVLHAGLGSSSALSPEAMPKAYQRAQAAAAKTQQARGLDPTSAQAAAVQAEEAKAAPTVPAATPGQAVPPTTPTPQAAPAEAEKILASHTQAAQAAGASPEVSQASSKAMAAGVTPEGKPNPDVMKKVQDVAKSWLSNPIMQNAQKAFASGKAPPEITAQASTGATKAIQQELNVPPDQATAIASSLTPDQQFGMWGGLGLAGVGMLTMMSGGGGILPLLMTLLGGGLAAGSGGFGADAQQGLHGMIASVAGGKYDPKLGLMGSLAMPKVEAEFAKSPEAAKARTAFSAGGLFGAKGVQDNVVQQVAAGIQKKMEADPQYKQYSAMLGPVGATKLSPQQYQELARRLLTRKT